MRCVVIAVGVAGCSFAPGWLPAFEDAGTGDDALIDARADAVIDAPPQSFSLHFEAVIDGRSNIIFKGATVQWHHYAFAAPGREGFTNLPTKLGAVNWSPLWPDVPNAENRDCDCASNLSPLAVGVPRAPSTTMLRNVVARRTVTVIKAPAANNDYTLEIELNDVGSGGSATYAMDIDVIVTP